MTKPWRSSLSSEQKKRLDDSSIDPLGHFDREGQLMGFGDWAEAIGDTDYKVVKRDEVGKYLVSTVWLGLDCRFGDPSLLEGKPIIFETMVFDQSGDHPWMDRYMNRYATEEEALKGHEEALVAVHADLIGTGE
jgi:hypothetical protein